jgi:predicted Zn finger-like uncharacterized protein
MALATRCPNCQAMFRVVSDQLKLRGGLVRCGNCRHVFDAIGSLSYVEDAALAAATPSPTAAAPAPAPSPAPGSPTAPDSRSAEAVEPRAADRTAGERADAGERPVARSAPIAPVPAPAPPAAPSADSSAARPRVAESAGARVAIAKPAELTTTPVDPLAVPTLLAAKGEPADEESIESIEVPPVAEPTDEAAIDATASTGAPAATRRPAMPASAQRAAASDAAVTEPVEPAVEEVSFLRDARPKRGFSLVYGGGSFVLALVLLLQLAVAFRTELLIRWPELRPRLASLCELYGCTVGWPTRAEQLAVLGTELQAVPGTDILELTAVVRNRAAFRMSLPAVEVTLTDTTNRTLARKVFAPVDYLASSGEPSSRLAEGLGPGSDIVVRVVFEARGLNAAGFVVYPFYL